MSADKFSRPRLSASSAVRKFVGKTRFLADMRGIDFGTVFLFQFSVSV
jgi:hypothetical protein